MYLAQSFAVVIKNISSKFLSLSNPYRKALLALVDFFLILLSLLVSAFSFGNQSIPSFPELYLQFLFLSFFGVFFCLSRGQYSSLTRYVGSTAFFSLAFRTLFLTAILYVFTNLTPVYALTYQICFSFFLFCSFLFVSSRILLRDFLIASLPSIRSQVRVVIYGAGSAGAQLFASLKISGFYKVLYFIDDSSSLWSRNIDGVAIHPPQFLLDHHSNVDQVLLAIPSLSRSSLRSIVDRFQSFGISILQIPSIDDISSGKARIDSLKPINIEELLGRDPVNYDLLSLIPFISGKSVCVTGAGGSIGSEICRQLVTLRPCRIVLLENSEPSLYRIFSELSELNSSVEIVPFLCDCTNQSLVSHCFSQYSVDVVFHAAAYKHVPLVESNPLSGIYNNIFSTLSVCHSTVCSDVKSMVLISSDKAVRPSNVMGATKRVCELILQAQSSPVTTFSMVRFGNVLGSSGSVVPRFRSQIARGGPITLTHPNIIRYFMTIPEAVQLVLYTLGMATSGDVFLLDMGNPVKIKDLAEQMILLSGCSVRNSQNPTGDIEIICTGLRPGEKLYEELLIDAASQETSHPLIYKARESHLPQSELREVLNKLKISLLANDKAESLRLLSVLVPE